VDDSVYMCDIGFDQNGLVRVKFANTDGMFYVDYNLNIVSEKFVAGKNVGRNIYAIETEDGIAGYFEYNGETLVRKTNG